jgi:signal transduction histidine kinase
MSVIGMMACSISHDMRHLLSAIYANAEFLERHDLSTMVRSDLLLHDSRTPRGYKEVKSEPIASEDATPGS